jgi:hypothetical protein
VPVLLLASVGVSPLLVLVAPVVGNAAVVGSAVVAPVLPTAPALPPGSICSLGQAVRTRD